VNKIEQEIHDLILRYYDIWEYIDTMEWLGDPENDPKDIETMKNLEAQQEKVFEKIIEKCKEIK
jgi:TPP-dependent 2-oxoacid decarboxylase